MIPAAGAGLAYGTATALGGSGFIAAFVAGVVFRLALGRDPEQLNRLTEEVGDVLNGVTFILFGAVLLGPTLTALSWQLVLYAVVSLTLVRMIPVAIAMWGTHAGRPTLGFLGWFGPRGLASIVFAVIVVEESRLPHEHLIVLAIYLTVGLSVLADGLTAGPLPASTQAGTRPTPVMRARPWRVPPSKRADHAGRSRRTAPLALCLNRIRSRAWGRGGWSRACGSSDGRRDADECAHDHEHDDQVRPDERTYLS